MFSDENLMESERFSEKNGGKSLIRIQNKCSELFRIFISDSGEINTSMSHRSDQARVVARHKS